jgi:quercetin dioxygenase-like cupin family protein
MPATRNLNRRQFLCFGVAPVVSVVPVKTSKPKVNKTRRVVTGIDTEGKSGIISDDGSSQVANHFESDKFQIRTLWLENSVPVNMTSNTETLDGYTFSFDPPKSGVIAIMVTCAPGFVGEHHRTQTIDFIFVISGAVELIMDKGKTTLYAGDTVIQRATFHTWRVVGNETCKFAAVLVGAEKLG